MVALVCTSAKMVICSKEETLRDAITGSGLEKLRYASWFTVHFLATLKVER